jgi:hypothetical protein
MTATMPAALHAHVTGQCVRGEGCDYCEEESGAEA